MAARTETTDERGSGTERVTVSLIPRASAELARLQDETSLSRTDLINRAISLYAFVSKQLEAGRELAVHDPHDDTTRIVYVT